MVSKIFYVHSENWGHPRCLFPVPMESWNHLHQNLGPRSKNRHQENPTMRKGGGCFWDMLVPSRVLPGNSGGDLFRNRWSFQRSLLNHLVLFWLFKSPKLRRIQMSIGWKQKVSCCDVWLFCGEKQNYPLLRKDLIIIQVQEFAPKKVKVTKMNKDFWASNH